MTASRSGSGRGERGTGRKGTPRRGREERKREKSVPCRRVTIEREDATWLTISYKTHTGIKART